MNILFVDDELEVLDGLVNGIDFEAIGIDNVYMATNAMRAKEFLATITVDILVTDIEMPDVSGIELLAWVVSQKLPVVSIFCTAYADFNYAQKAIALHAFDYFLKPIYLEELTRKLAAAVEEVRRRKTQRSYEIYNEVLKGFGQELRNHFWQDMLENITDPSKSLRLRLEQKYGVAYLESDHFSLFVADLLVRKNVWKAGEGFGMDEFFIQMQNWLGQYFSMEMEAFFLVRKQEAVFLLHTEKAAFEKELAQRVCQMLLENCNQQFMIDCNFYYKENLLYSQVFPAYQKIEAIFRRNIAARNQIYNVDTYMEKPGTYVNPCMQDWELLLSGNRTEEFMAQVMRFYKHLGWSEDLGHAEAKAFRTDILQLVYSVLQSKKLVAHELFDNAEFEERYVHACDSVEKMQEFVSYVCQTALSTINRYEKAGSIVEKVKKYIELHLGENITRENLAELFYFNPDYLARLFKSQEGTTISIYIREMRMERAKQLLRLSHKAIGTVAYEVGYDNFSYFSQLFRKHTGLSPKEYRCRSRSAGSDEE